MKIEIVGDSLIIEGVEYVRKEQVKEEKPYEFKAGDVVEHRVWGKRIIILVGHTLKAIDEKCEVVANGQEEFKELGYKKIGVISDFIK